MIYRTRSEIVKSVEYQSSLLYFQHVSGSKNRLYYCKAWIIKPDFSDFVILESYSTIVAAFQYSIGVLWVFGHYSTTTAQHVAKFRNWIRHGIKTGWNYPKVVRLYNDSKTGKCSAQKHLEDDFASVISIVLNQS